MSIATPNKSCANLKNRDDAKSSRRSRGMRSGNSVCEESKNSSYTPNKISGYANGRSESTNAYTTQRRSKRSHTPMTYGQKKVTAKKRSSFIEPKEEPREVSNNTSYIVNENLRLRLHKSSRAVTMKHLSNL